MVAYLPTYDTPKIRYSRKKLQEEVHANRRKSIIIASNSKTIHDSEQGSKSPFFEPKMSIEKLFSAISHELKVEVNIVNIFISKGLGFN